MNLLASAWPSHPSTQPHISCPPRSPPCREAIIDKVYRSRQRPQFPLDAVEGYVALATACWHDVPAQRPTFDVIVQRLNELLVVARATDLPLLQL